MNSSAKNPKSAVPCPCIRHCCLDQEDICLGCFRSLEEILNWSQSTDSEKRKVLRLCEQRRAAKKF
ncbi:DUF1289 domain-containing protein [Vibrio aquaticus]|uniref:DUF1289 domain-containing protein n=1 Tax=Vibrio aquaticus TaxID=2496559 RepID=A0A432CXJ4_9VIBR|nr:DUF1289 domain-containing protein [Vibrio aquaticus]RTZ16620.1 DUF1289 domain-containing protein [Vibrio aquaticus]